MRASSGPVQPVTVLPRKFNLEIVPPVRAVRKLQPTPVTSVGRGHSPSWVWHCNQAAVFSCGGKRLC
jgi:hypothetical protein